MFYRFALLFACAILLSACSSVPNNYAFWRDGETTSATGKKPNLGDVPAPPNTQDAKAEMETIKQRLQQDRDNAYLTAQGITPITDATSDSTQSANVIKDELAPLPTPAMIPQTASAFPAYPPAAPGSVNVGNVQYNYTPSNDTYAYGYMPLMGGASSPAQQRAASVMAANPNVSIDFSALGGDSVTIGGDNGTIMRTMSPGSLSGQPLVYFKHGSARLGTLDKQRLRELATRLKQQPASLVVIGHASQRTGSNDPVNAQNANLQISARRATAVLNELAHLGVAADRIKLTASGDALPNMNPQGMRQEDADRRVEILFDR